MSPNVQDILGIGPHILVDFLLVVHWHSQLLVGLLQLVTVLVMAMLLG